MTPAGHFPLYLVCIILNMNSDERGSVFCKQATCSCNYKVTLKIHSYVATLARI